MKNNTYILLIGFFIILIYAGSQINNTKKTSPPEFYELSHAEKQKIITEDSTREANEAEEYYTKMVLEEVPLTNDETPELVKYRKDLRLWYEWDNECMGMDPNSKPRDPRIKNKE
jgi:hypothetical protein